MDTMGDASWGEDRHADARAGGGEARDRSAESRPASASMRMAYYERVRDRRSGHPAEAWFGGIGDARERATTSAWYGRAFWTRIRRAVADFF